MTTHRRNTSSPIEYVKSRISRGLPPPGCRPWPGSYDISSGTQYPHLRFYRSYSLTFTFTADRLAKEPSRTVLALKRYQDMHVELTRNFRFQSQSLINKLPIPVSYVNNFLLISISEPNMKLWLFFDSIHPYTSTYMLKRKWDSKGQKIQIVFQ